MALNCSEHHSQSKMTSFSEFDPSQHLTPAQLVERWKDTPFPTTLVTLARWRGAGKGPAFIRAGHNGKRVFYPLSAVASYESNVYQVNA